MSESPPTPDALSIRMVEVIYRLFEGLEDWPAYEQLDYETDRERLGDAWELLRQLEPGLVGGSDFRTAPSATQSFHLTVGGMALAATRSDAAATDLRVFYLSVVAASHLSDGTRPPESATLNASELAQLVDIPASGRAHVLTRVGRLWQVNAHLWTGFHGVGDSWSATLDRRALRAYRAVEDRASFVAAERARLVRVFEDRVTLGLAQRDPAGDVVTSTPESPVAGRTDPAGGGGVPIWFDLMPTGLGSHLRSRVESGHVEDAFLHGWRLLARMLSAKSGLSGDGTDLVNRVSRSFATPEDSTEANVVQGRFDLLRSLARVRNVQSHAGSEPFTELEAAASLLALGACWEWCDRLPDAQQ